MFDAESFLRTLTSTPSSREYLAELEGITLEESERRTLLQLQQMEADRLKRNYSMKDLREPDFQE